MDANWDPSSEVQSEESGGKKIGVVWATNQGVSMQTSTTKRNGWVKGKEGTPDRGVVQITLCSRIDIW